MEGMADGAGIAGARILVVEDDDDSREMVVAVLAGCGAQVHGVARASEALVRLEQEVPDAIVCDIAMPGQDGHSLMRAIRALPRKQGGRVPAIALTALGTREARIASRDAGFHYHLEKPIQPEKLTALLASLLRLSGR
jgi:CheY-like chemotaxis protein